MNHDDNPDSDEEYEFLIESVTTLPPTTTSPSSEPPTTPEPTTGAPAHGETFEGPGDSRHAPEVPEPRSGIVRFWPSMHGSEAVAYGFDVVVMQPESVPCEVDELARHCLAAMPPGGVLVVLLESWALHSYTSTLSAALDGRTFCTFAVLTDYLDDSSLHQLVRPLAHAHYGRDRICRNCSAALFELKACAAKLHLGRRGLAPWFVRMQEAGLDVCVDARLRYSVMGKPW